VLIRKTWVHLGLLGSLLLFSVILLHAPMSIWAANAHEFEFSGFAFLGLLLIALAVAMVIVWSVLHLLPTSMVSVLSALLTALGLVLWAYVYLLFPHALLLDGRQIAFDFSTALGRWEPLFLLLPIAALALLARLRPRSFVVFLAAVQVGLCGVTVFELVRNRAAGPQAGAGNPAPLWRFSPTRNVLVILLDGFQSDIFAQFAAQEPNLRQRFDGFTLFRNMLAVAPSTLPTMPAIHSGRDFDANRSLRVAYEQDVRHDSFLNDLANAGFETSLVHPIRRVCPNDIHLCIDISSVLGRRQAALFSNSVLLLDMALMRAVPFTYKNQIFNGQSWFLSQRLGGSHIAGEHVAFNRVMTTLSSSLVVESARPAAKFMHLLSTHAPYVLNEKCEPHGDGAGKPESSARCAIESFLTLLEALRRNGVYDKTVVAVIADHGAGIASGYAGAEAKERLLWAALAGAANPIFLVKPLDAHGPLVDDERAVSVTDIGATVCALADACGPVRLGTSAFASNRPSGTRRFHSYQWRHELWSAATIPGVTEYQVAGPLWRYASWRRRGPAPSYALGNAINFSVPADLQTYGEFGFSEAEPSGSWVVGDTAEIRLRPKESAASDLDLIVNARAFVSSAQPRQEVDVTVNREPVARWFFDSTATVEKRARIPRRLTQGTMTVTFRVSAPHSPASLGLSDDPRSLGLGLADMVLTPSKPGLKHSALDRLPASYRVGDAIDFRNSGDPRPFFGGGWSEPEPWGTWTTGDTAELRLQPSGWQGEALDLIILARAFVTPSYPTQTVEVLANGYSTGRVVLDSSKEEEKRLRLPDAIKPGEPLVLTFRMLAARSPAELGLSNDTRYLGIGVASLTITATDIRR